MHSIVEVDENDKSKSKQTDIHTKGSPPVPQMVRPVYTVPYGTALQNQAPLITSNFTSERQYQYTSPPGSQFNAPIHQTSISRKQTAGDNSLLNTSLNASVRIQKSLLKKMDMSIAEGKNLDEDSESVVELNIDDNGFLLDGQGFPILNDKGEPMKLTDDNIDFLKENGLYEEAVIDDCGN